MENAYHCIRSYINATRTLITKTATDWMKDETIYDVYLDPKTTAIK